jgi:probable HAF family extracellular repeat protein
MFLHTRLWTLSCGLTVIALLSLAFTIWAPAESAVSHSVVPNRPVWRVAHTRYRLVDLGTFGGPASFINEPFNSVPAINNFGMTVGGSTISVPLTSKSNPLVCGGVGGTIPFVNHAFRWKGNLVTDLGALGSVNSNCSDASAVNDLGQIAGQSEIDEIDPLLGVKEMRAALFLGNRILNLGTLGGAESTAYGINNRGQVVGFALNTIPDPLSIVDSFIFGSSGGTQTRAVLWQDGIIRDLGTLGGPDGFASFVNERGQIAGFSYLNSTPNATTGLPTVHPFLWEHGRMRDLGSLGGTLAGLGSISVGGLNDRGEVIGLSTLQGDPGCGSPTGCVADAFLWSRGKMIDLSTSTIGGSPIGTFAINNAGEIVGAGAFPNAPFDAYVWRDGVASDLGHLGDCGSLGFAINSKDQVVGGTFSCADFTHSTAFLWENGAIVDLNQQIPAPSSLHLVVAIAINDRGEIAGIGVPPGVAPANYDSLGHAFLLIPASEGLGEPISEHRLTRSEATAIRVRLAGMHRGLRRWPRN